MIHIIRQAHAAFLDKLLGARCHVCGIRVFPSDQAPHYRGACAGRGAWPA